MIARGLSGQHALDVFNDLRNSIERSKAKADRTNVGVTISIGICDRPLGSLDAMLPPPMPPCTRPNAPAATASCGRTRLGREKTPLMAKRGKPPGPPGEKRGYQARGPRPVRARKRSSTDRR